jgi:hypothetical protein
LDGTVTISPNTGVTTGTELTANYSGSESVTLSYQWEKDGSNVGTNSNKFTPTLAGSYTVTVSAAGYNSKTSAAVTVALPDLSGTITITPVTAAVGTTLTATYSGSETVSYQWKNGTTNVGTNSNKYTPTAEGSYTVTVSATGYNSKTSAAVTVAGWSISTFGTDDIYAIAYGNGKFVAGDNNGKMAYSTDCVTWTAVTDSKFGTAGIFNIAYGNNTFVAVGHDYKNYESIIIGNMAYSTDGVTWTAVTDSTFGTAGIFNIAYDNNTFVAGGSGGKMATSPDGITWTAVTNSTFSTYEIYNIAYGNNMFIAVGNRGKMAYSTEGSTWTAVTNSTFGTSDAITAIAYGNNKFVAGSHNGKMATSTDGTTWTAIPVSTFDIGLIYEIAYGNNKFVAVGANGKIAYLSE